MPRTSLFRWTQRWFWGGVLPTFVFEGDKAPSNISALRTLASDPRSPQVHFFPVPGETHFSAIAPLVERLSAAIKRDGTSQSVFVLGPK